MHVGKSRGAPKRATAKAASAYSQLSKAHSEALKAAKDYAATILVSGEATAEQTAEVKRLTEVSNGYRVQLDAIDNSLGNYQRNVGNYTHQTLGASQATITLSKGLGGLAGLAGLTARALGLDSEVVHTLTEASHEMIRGARELSHVKHLEHLAHQENTVSIGEEIGATNILNASKEEEAVVTKEVSIVEK